MDNYLYQSDTTLETIDRADYKYHYNEAEKLEKEGTLESLESAIVHIEMAINNLNEKKEILPEKSLDSEVKKFAEHQLMIKTNYHEKRIKKLLEEAKNEEKRKDFKKSVNLYKKIRDSMNFLYKLGNKGIDINEINEVKEKISKLTKKILNENLSISLNKKSSKTEQKPYSDEFKEINAEFEEINFGTNDQIPLQNHDTEGEMNPITEVESKVMDQVELAQSEIILLEDNEVEEDSIDSLDKPNKINGLDQIMVISDTPEIEENSMESEILDKKSVKMLLAQLRKTLIANNYQIFPNDNIDFQELYNKIDFLAIKTQHINEFLDICHILPLKLAKLYGLLLISEKKIDYNSNNTNLSPIERKNLVKSIKEDLNDVVQILSNDLEDEGPIVKNFISYINDDISLEKTRISSKGYFYYRGRMQYNFIIQPIIISQNKIGFLERNIPYAFQQSSDLYIVNINDLTDLLSYLEQKRSSIEKICIKKQPINLFIDNKIKLSNALRLISILLGVFGVSDLISLFVNDKIFVSVFQVLLIPFIMGIILLTGIFIYIYKKNQYEIIQNYNSPFGFDHPDFDRQNLSIALNQINPHEREQFLYEIYNKRPIPNDLLKKIENPHTFSEFVELFETNLVNIAITNENLNKLKQFFNYFKQKHSFYKAYCILRSILVLKIRDFIGHRLNKSADEIHNISSLLDIICAECNILFENKSIEAIKRIEKIRELKGHINQISFTQIVNIVYNIIEIIQKNTKLTEDYKEINNFHEENVQKFEENTVFERSIGYMGGDPPENIFKDFLKDD